MKQFIAKIFTSICLLFVVPNFNIAQEVKTEDDLVRYLDSTTNLDIIEGIYYYRSTGNDVWNAIIYDNHSGDFVFYKIDSKSRELEPYCGQYETHIVRTTKYSYTYYAYVLINKKKYESSTTWTYDAQHTQYHWCCNTPIDGNWHVSINLNHKVYPK